MKRNWLKIAIIIVAITFAAGAMTPLFGDAFTKLFSLPSTTMDWMSPEGKITATIDRPPGNKSERGRRSTGWEFGSFILLGGGMLILASWGRRKVRR